MTSERVARLLLFAGIVGLPLAVLLAGRTPWRTAPDRIVEIRGTMPESGGWIPGELTVAVGEPLHLRLSSDDVVHGFAVGAFDMDPIDIMPGEVTETTIEFSRPGKYVYYCTRWCGVNHWRMRGTINVTGEAPEPDVPATPLYLSLNIDLDAPHPANILPAKMPSAERAAELEVTLPTEYSARAYYQSHSSVEAWKSLRAEPLTNGLSDMAVWDLVAVIWERNTTPETLASGRALYAANCAACHGEDGAGDGVMAAALVSGRDSLSGFGASTTAPTNFSDAEQMLGASPALLHGKVLRGGMGTGMPYWGPVFTGEQIWAVVDFLWTFQFSVLDPLPDKPFSDSRPPERE